MTDKNREIIFLEPELKENVWGGNRLVTEFHYRDEGDGIGECWGISAHPHGDCKIAEGTWKGKTLSWLYREHRELFGNVKAPEFPLLVKIIDAKEKLSIQVHPDDAYAKEHENGSLGKTECWYVLDCPEDAELVIGHNAKTREELADMVHAGLRADHSRHHSRHHAWNADLGDAAEQRRDVSRLRLRKACERKAETDPRGAEHRGDERP